MISLGMREKASVAVFNFLLGWEVGSCISAVSEGSASGEGALRLRDVFFSGSDLGGDCFFFFFLRSASEEESDRSEEES